MSMLKLTPAQLDQAAMDGMISLIREQIRDAIMKVVQPDIDAAVDAACAQFKVRITTYKDHAMFGEPVVHAIVERK
jgi:hypothetical protein